MMNIEHGMMNVKVGFPSEFIILYSTFNIQKSPFILFFVF